MEPTRGNDMLDLDSRWDEHKKSQTLRKMCSAIESSFQSEGITTNKDIQDYFAY